MSAKGIDVIAEEVRKVNDNLARLCAVLERAHCRHMERTGEEYPWAIPCADLPYSDDGGDDE